MDVPVAPGNLFTQAFMVNAGRLILGNCIRPFPLKVYALFELPNRSNDGVIVPIAVPLLLFPLSSFVFPLNGHHPTSPLEGT